MNPKTQNILMKILTVTALIPGLYLLWLVMVFMPDFVDGFLRFRDFMDFALIVLVLLGSLAFVGLVFQLMTPLKSKLKWKAWFLGLGVLGYVCFISLMSGLGTWLDMFKMLSDMDYSLFGFYIQLWPNLTALFLMGFNLWMLKKSRNDR